MPKEEITKGYEAGALVEVFATNVQSEVQAKFILEALERSFPELKINFDLNDYLRNPELSYPCGHSILRIQGKTINSENVVSIIHQSGFKCDILEDRVCNQTTNTITEFWENAFKEKQEMWGFEPAKSAILTKDFFIEKGIKNILIAGIGYGRNAQIFRENRIEVTGIEISKTAIELARKHYGTEMNIYHGSVTDMPFDNNQYDGIFCYALIHLLDSNERAKLISDCFNQLSDNGYMVFTTITKESQTYRQGTYISKDRFEMFGGVKIFFYDRETIQEEFGKAGLFEVTEVSENFPFYLIKCQKVNTDTKK